MNVWITLLGGLGQSGGNGTALWMLATTPLVLLVIYFLNARSSHEDRAEMNQHLNRLDRHMAEMASQQAKLTEALSDFTRQNAEQHEELIDALDRIQEVLVIDEEAEHREPQADDPPASSPEPEPAVDPMPQATVQVAAPAVVNDDSFEEAVALLRNMEADHPANLLKARELFLKCLNGPKKGPATTLLSETLFWLGDISTVKDDKDKFHEEGVNHGKQAVELEPNSAAAHLWYAANMGSHGVVRGIMSSLFYIGPMEKHGLRAMELDRNFFHCGPVRLMGRFYHQCPGWPVGKGDMNKSIQLLTEASEKGSEFLLNHLYLADALIARKKKKEASEVIDEILGREKFTLMPNYQRNVQEQARKLKAKL